MASDPAPAAFKKFATAQRSALLAVWQIACTALPGSERCIAWGMPSLRVDGDLVLSLQGFRDHNSVFPGPGVIERLGSKLATVEVTKGTIHFPREIPMRASLVRAIIKARIAEINDSYPRSSGAFKEFYENGWLKARGRIKDGVMNGAWMWFRRDGTRKRSGSFRMGVQVGEWVTYDASGDPYKRTNIDADQSAR